MLDMNKLLNAKRVQILSMLCEGSSMRAISRVADASINTVAKLLADAGEACAAFHDQTVRGVKAKRVQCYEIWAFATASSGMSKPPRLRPKKPMTCGHGRPWTRTRS